MAESNKDVLFHSPGDDDIQTVTEIESCCMVCYKTVIIITFIAKNKNKG